MAFEMTSSPISSDAIYLAMRSRIVSGEWGPGFRLVQRRLAQEFGSSSIPVLESIRRLESDHLVVSHPNAGAQVRTWTERDVEGVFAAREALEGATCRRFAEQASLAERERVAGLSRRFDDCVKEEELEESIQADVQLHLYIMNRSLSPDATDALAALAHNAYLLSLTIRSVTLPGSSQQAEERSSGPVGAHEALIAAFKQRDAEAAEQAIKEHVRQARDTVLRALVNRGLSE